MRVRHEPQAHPGCTNTWCHLQLQAPHDLQPEQLPSGLHEAAGINHHSDRTRRLKGAMASASWWVSTTCGRSAHGDGEMFWTPLRETPFLRVSKRYM